MDLGCGRGQDSKFLIEHGFQVTAIDGDRSVEDFILPELMASSDFKFINTKIEDYNFKKDI